VTAVNAEIDDTNANVVVVNQARIDGDSALGTQLDTVSTTVAGNTASITSLVQSVNGISARWGVSVSAQGYVQGLVQLDGNATGSTFTVIANTFQVALPGQTGGAAVPAFVVGAVNGTPAIGIRAEVLLDGSITARAISVSSLSAITANIGTVTAGLIKDAAGTYEFRVPLGWWGSANGSNYIDMKNGGFQFTVP
jgi:hypothetical protein